VHTVPFSALQPAGASPVSSGVSFPKNLEDLRRNPMSIAAIASLLWIIFFGFALRGMVLSPLRKAGVAVLNAAHGSTPLTPEIVKRFGHDEVGQIVQASSILLQNLEEEKKKFAVEREQEFRKGQALVEQKTKEAENLVSAAQQQAQQLKQELNDKSQHLNDKLKELDALKGMSEGLRNQNEQAKSEIAKLKSQTNAADETQKELNQKLAQAQDQLKQMEVKLFSTVAASSAIHVSQVRAAAIRTMAEELKTTLGIIKGYVSSALGTTQGGINEKQQEFLGMVINRAARLEKFINDLLDIYQVEIEQADAKYEEVNLAAEIEGLAFNFQPQVEVKNVKLKIEAKPNLPKVPIVRRRFNQLWNILYLQIIKDAPRGSGITISVEPIGETVKVTVPDPGLTVTPESLPKLFDEFYDPKHPASPQLAGTGLKFALVKTILAAHGGGAVAEKGDPGTKLLLTFPIRIKKPGEAPAAAPQETPPLKTSSASAAAATPAPKAALPFTLGPKPALAPPSFGAPKPQAVATSSASMPGIPKPLTPLKPVAAAPAAVPKPAETVSSSGNQPGLLDALISKAPLGKEPDLKPSTAAPDEPATPKPVLPAASTTGIPSFPSGTGMGKISATSELLDSLLEKKAGGGLASPAKPTASSLTPSTGADVKLAGIPPSPPVELPKPSVPPAPPTAMPPVGAPKTPSLGMAGGLDALLEKKPEPPALGSIPPSGSKVFPGMPPKPASSAGATVPPPLAPKPPASGTVPPSPPITSAPSMSGPPKPQLSTPGAGPGSTAKPPMPPVPPLAGSAASAPSKVVPTSIKPTVPPADLLKFESTDTFKMDAQTGALSSSPGVKPPIPTPPPGNKSIVKDLNKEGEGDLIE
jgi:signal transduction histidine kinase